MDVDCGMEWLQALPSSRTAQSAGRTGCVWCFIIASLKHVNRATLLHIPAFMAVAARFAADNTIAPGYDEMHAGTQEDMLIVRVIVQTV